MRTGISAAVVSVVVLGLAPQPALAQQRDVPPAAAAVTPIANPTLAASCGIDVSLVLDASSSIQTSGSINRVRDIGFGLADALAGTGSTLQISEFATFARTLAQRESVNSTTVGGTGLVTAALGDYYKSEPGKPAGVTIYDGTRERNDALSYSNWSAGLSSAGSADLTIVVTDGAPTAHDAQPSSVRVSAQPSPESQDAAITTANSLKSQGSRVLAVGVGKSLTDVTDQQRLQEISGPQIVVDPSALAGKTIDEVDAVAVQDVAAIASLVRSTVTSICGNQLTVRTLAQSSSSAEYLPASGNDVTVRPSVAGGYSWVAPQGPQDTSQTLATAGQRAEAEFGWRPNDAGEITTIKVTAPSGDDYVLDHWTCYLNLPTGQMTDGTGPPDIDGESFEFTLDPGTRGTCTVYFAYDFKPAIEVEKSSETDPVRGDDAGWNEKYRIDVSNTGNSDLLIPTPTDPQCASISDPSGTGAKSGILAPATTWVYDCDAQIGPVPTGPSATSAINTVSVTGIDPTGTEVSDSAQATVDVLTPGIALGVTARKAGTSVAIADGGTVPTGASVTYEYSVSNTGNDVLVLDRATAVTDVKCASVQYVSGDTNNDEQLDLGETWLYECTTVLNPPITRTSVTHTADVTAAWSNPDDAKQNNAPVTARDHMTINVSTTAKLRLVLATNPGSVDLDFAFGVQGQGVDLTDQSFDLNSSSEPMRQMPLDVTNSAGQAFTITQTIDTDWDLTGLSCDKTPDSSDQSTGAVTVTVLPDEIVTCSYTNERRPSVVLGQKSSGDSSAVPFDFLASRPSPLANPSPAAFTLTGSEEQTFTSLEPGEFTLKESKVAPGWERDWITCSGTFADKSSAAAGEVTLDLGYGDVARCDYLHAQLAPARLTITNASAYGTWQPTGSYVVTGPGATIGTPDLAWSESISYELRPSAAGATYGIQQSLNGPASGESAFVSTNISCVQNNDSANVIVGDTGTGVVQVLLEPGDHAVCTYVNSQLPRVTITNDGIDPSNPITASAFDFNATGLAPTSFSLSNDAGSRVFADLTPISAFTVTQAAEAGWTLTNLTCAGRGSDSVTTDIANAQISSTGLNYGDDVVCAFVPTNQAAKAYLIVQELSVPATDDQSFGFTLTGSDLNEVPSLSTGQTVGYEVDPGGAGALYDVKQDKTYGWSPTGIECRVSSDPANPFLGTLADGKVSVPLLPGDVAVCTYVNSRQSVVTIKVDANAATTQEFGLKVSDSSGSNTISLKAGHAGVVYLGSVPALTVQEKVPTAAPQRWHMASMGCVGASSTTTFDYAQASMVLEVGPRADIICTFTNALSPSGSAQIAAAANPPDGTLFDFTAAGADGGVTNADKTFQATSAEVKSLTLSPAIGGENFTFAEPAAPANWSLAAAKCYDNGVAVGSSNLTAVGGSAEASIQPGQSVACEFSNNRDGIFTVASHSPADPQKVFDYDWWSFSPPGGAQLHLTDGQLSSFLGQQPGKFSIQELTPSRGWTVSSGAGQYPICTGTKAAVKYDPLRAAEVTLAKGERVVCAYANFYDPKPIITLAKSADRQIVLEGSPITYGYSLTNLSGAALEPVGQVDDVVADDTCPGMKRDTTGSDQLADAGTWEFSCTISATAPADSLSEATATLQDPSDPGITYEAKDEVTVRVLSPKLGLSMTASDRTIYSGATVEYHYTAANLGETEFKGAQDRSTWLVDDKCATVAYVSGDSNDDSIMGVGEVWKYSCTAASLSADTISAATFTGTPFIDASLQSGDKQTGQAVEAKATVSVSVLAPGIALKLDSSTGSTTPGSAVTYMATADTGAGTTPMQVIGVDGDACAPFAYATGDDDSDGLLDPSEQWIYTCSTAFIGSASVENSVGIGAIEPQLGGLYRDSAKTSVEVFQAGLSITKTPEAQAVPKGSSVVYGYDVTNTGTTELAELKVSDAGCNDVRLISGDAGGDDAMSPGEEWKYECSSQANADSTTMARVTAKLSDSGSISAATAATVLVVEGDRLRPRIAVTNQPSKTKVAKGTKVRYDYEVTSPGTMALADVKVSDDKCANPAYVSGDLNGDGLLSSAENGEGWTNEVWRYSCTAVVKRTVTNAAEVTAIPWDGIRKVGAAVTASKTAKVRVTTAKQKPLWLKVVPSKKCTTNPCKVIKLVTADKRAKVKYKVTGLPVGMKVRADLRYIRSWITADGGVMVEAFGSRPIKVNVTVTAVPKDASSGLKPVTWTGSVVMRP